MGIRTRGTTWRNKRIMSDSSSNVETPITPDAYNDVATPSEHIKVETPIDPDANNDQLLKETPIDPDANNDEATLSKCIKLDNPTSPAANIIVASPADINTIEDIPTSPAANIIVASHSDLDTIEDIPTSPAANIIVASHSDLDTIEDIPTSPAANIIYASPSDLDTIQNSKFSVGGETGANFDVGSNPNVIIEFVQLASSPPNTPYSQVVSGRKRKSVKDNEKTSVFTYGSEEEEGNGDDECLDPTDVPSFQLCSETERTEVLLESSIINDCNQPIYLDDLASQINIEEIFQPLSTSPMPPPSLVNTEDNNKIRIYKPTDLFEFKWQKYPDPRIPPNLRKETFTGNKPGPKFDYVNPYEAFIAIWDKQIMTQICKQTNLYAQQRTEHMMNTGKLGPSSRVTDWTDITINELYTYFGILLAMGILVKSRVEEYWGSKQDIFSTPGFSVCMKFNRFNLINKFLHFTNNQDMQNVEFPHGQAKLFKLQSIIDHLNRKFSTLYNLSQDIALYDFLVPKRNLNIRRCIPNKAAQGLEIHEICETDTGYLWRFKVHVSSEPSQNSGPETGETSIVLKMIQGLEFKGHTLWMDHYYNSPALARTLKSMQIDCVGTLSTNQKYVPPELDSLQEAQMPKGQLVGCTSGDVDLLVWKGDMTRMGLISTYHGPGLTTCSDSVKPTLLRDYNVCMKKVNESKRKLIMCHTARTRTNIWYTAFFRRLLNVSVLNAYIMYKFNTPTSKHRDFSLKLVRQLLAKHMEDREIGPLPVGPSAVKFPKELLKHLPAEYGFDATGTHKMRRLCVVCKHRTHTYCPGCDAALCAFRRTQSVTHCFRVHHT